MEDISETIMFILKSYGKTRSDGGIDAGWFKQVTADILYFIIHNPTTKYSTMTTDYFHEILDKSRKYSKIKEIVGEE